MRRKVPLLRGLSILAVLIGHAALWAMQPLEPARGQALTLEGHLFWQYSLLGAVTELSYFCVPAFFFTSGLFCTFALQKPGLSPNLAFIKARLKGLFVPLALWSVLAFLVTWGIGSIRSLPAYFSDRLALGQIEWGYFFPLAMAQVYLLSPFLVDQCRRRPGRALLVAGLIQAAAVAFRLTGSLGGFLSDIPTVGAAAGNYALWRWVAYVVAGIVAGLHTSAIERWLIPRRGRLLALTLCSAAFMFFEGHLLMQATRDARWLASQTRPGAILFACASLALFFSRDVPKGAWVQRVEQVGAISFALFLVHPIVYRVLHHLLIMGAPEVAATQPVFLSGFYLLAGGLPCALVLHRLFRSKYRGLATTWLGH